jgi:N,N'-diacetyllegionaminate synthase
MKNNSQILDLSAAPIIIAEVAQAHDGSLGMAHAYIDAAAEAGADAIKFQTHIADAESTLDEPFRVKFSLQDETRYDYWKRMEFTTEQWIGLANHAREKGLYFLSSPFSVEAVDLLEIVGVAGWKIGSGEAFSINLLNVIFSTNKPILLSTGMSNWEEIDTTVSILKSRNLDFVILQCTSKYPTPLEEVGLNVVEQIRLRYDVPAGLSDHSGTPWPAIIALARGASAIEVHVTFDRHMFGPDTKASVTFKELSMICAARDAMRKIDKSPVDKDLTAIEMRTMRDTFGKSLAPRYPMTVGEIITRDSLTTKKPATGISYEDINKVVGKKLNHDVSPDRLLRWDDLEVKN